MRTPKDGGAAFPVPPDSVASTGDPRDGIAIVEAHQGMSLLDWFAGKALAGWVSCPETRGNQKEASEWCYDFAEAMLTEREKRMNLNQ